MYQRSSASLVLSTTCAYSAKSQGQNTKGKALLHGLKTITTITSCNAPLETFMREQYMLISLLPTFFLQEFILLI